MATTSAQPDEYECPVCHENFTTPKILPCAHILCRHCLVTWLQSDTNAHCPLCRDAICKESERADKTCNEIADALPTDLAMEARVECAAILSKSHVCGGCRNTTATAICLTCGDMLCATCTTTHRNLSATKHHKVEDLSTMTAEDLAASRQMACSVHPDKTCELFCSTHGAAICHLCATARHRACPEVSELEERIQEARGVFAELAATLKAGESTLDRAISQLNEYLLDMDTARQASLAEIERMQDRLSRSLDACCRRLREQAQAPYSHAEQRVEQEKAALFKRRARVTSHWRLVERVGDKMPRVCAVSDTTSRLQAALHSLDLDASLPADLKIVSKTTQTIEEKALKSVEHELRQIGQRSGKPVSSPASRYDSTPASSADFSPASSVVSTPASRADTPPASRADSPPASRAVSPTASRADSPPASRADSPPASRADSPTASRANSTPASSADSPTASRGDSTPASSADSTPASSADSTPASSADSTPASRADYTLASHADSKPASRAESTPASHADSTPASRADSPTASRADSTPASRADYQTASHADSTPASPADFTLASNADSTPSSRAEPTPASHADFTPASRADSPTASRADSTPALRADSRTASHADSTPASRAASTLALHADSTPASRAESTPASHADSTPASRADSPTASRADSTPASRADSPIASRANSTPASRADSRTAPRADSTPASRADSTPASRADSTPASRADCRTASHADSTPASRAESTPASHAESTPASHADSTPASRADSPTASRADSTPAKRFTGHKSFTLGQPTIWGFHAIHGDNIVLSCDQTKAERMSGYWGSIVFSADAMSSNILYEVMLGAVEEDTHQRFLPCGVTDGDPASLSLPAHSAGSTHAVLIERQDVWVYGSPAPSIVPAMFSVREGSRVGVMVDTHNRLHLFLDRRDIGVAATNIRRPCHALFEILGPCKMISTLQTTAL